MTSKKGVQTMNTTRIILGVTGGIAAFKSVTILRILKKKGYDVVVVPTDNALKMVGKKTFEALSENPVSTSVFEAEKGFGHIELADSDLLLIVPATANFIAKMSSGIADDLLSNIFLATHAPTIIAPAMHTNMFNHFTTQKNLSYLKKNGVHVLEPVTGQLSNTDVGKGRLQDEQVIADYAISVLQASNCADASFEFCSDSQLVAKLSGKSILITGGGTREYIDPVRFITNSSSGKQALALAEVAHKAGAKVHFIAANIPEEKFDLDYRVTHVVTAEEMAKAVADNFADCDITIMCAAVSDWKVENFSEVKLKKVSDKMQLELVQTTDILKEISELNHSRNLQKLIVGFAAETGDNKTILEYAKDKIKKKKCDLLVLNPVGTDLGFNKDENTVSIIDNNLQILAQMSGSKLQVAQKILEVAAEKMS